MDELLQYIIWNAYVSIDANTFNACTWVQNTSHRFLFAGRETNRVAETVQKIQPKPYVRAGTNACGPGGRPLIEGDDDRDAGSN